MLDYSIQRALTFPCEALVWLNEIWEDHKPSNGASLGMSLTNTELEFPI